MLSDVDSRPGFNGINKSSCPVIKMRSAQCTWSFEVFFIDSQCKSSLIYFTVYAVHGPSISYIHVCFPHFKGFAVAYVAVCCGKCIMN